MNTRTGNAGDDCGNKKRMASGSTNPAHEILPKVKPRTKDSSVKTTTEKKARAKKVADVRTKEISARG